MIPGVHVHMLPSLFDPEQLVGGVAVILDILRASSTITTALNNGAARVVPFGNIAQATSWRDAQSTGTALLGGERGGIRIDGFDLSNSPADYSSTAMNNRSVGFTTTNGTRALLRSAKANHVVVGSFLNIQSIVSFLNTTALPVHLVCAGTNGCITGEDVLCAGAIAEELMVSGGHAGSPPLSCDSTLLARTFWRSVIGRLRQPDDEPSNENLTDTENASTRIAEALRHSQGGRNLLSLGYDADIDRCSQLNSVPVLPCFDPGSGEITLRHI